MEESISPSWFWGKLQNDGLIVRMHITVGHGRAPETEARAYVCWNDDMAYNRGMLVYRHDDYDGKSGVSVEPLGLEDQSSGIDWDVLFRRWTLDWQGPWRQEAEIVCTTGYNLGSARVVPPSNPQMMVHLARFQAAAATTEDSAWRITLGIAERRLGGIVRAGLRDWSRLLG